ncbi:MFS transporter [Glaciimonas sp. PAMC28666]|uniref:MFS transporter n=1 Tax=Glaciimonas sp. PAMC28666 TaxID=2807626 RepID=UPI001966B2FE|nr:MFS transporter [Glaciimonas sp. PAMC28666]QRX80966.1 MFS transporter [Glaciimonas sp. PAMC28666]
MRPVSTAPPAWRDLLAGSNALRSVALTGGVALHAINVHIVTTILPSVVRDIGGLPYYAWNTTLFIVASILGSTLSAKLIDLLHPRAAYLFALAVFSIGTIGCATAPNMVWMLAGRSVQGLGGGILAALSYALIRIVFEERLWSRAVALVSGMWGVATLFGPAVGGLFAQSGNWRLAFWVLLPIAALQAVIVNSQVKGDRNNLTDTGTLKVPFGKILLLAASVLVIAFGALFEQTGWKVAGVATGLALGFAVARLDRHATVRLLPTGAYSLQDPLGATFACVCLLMVGTTTEIFVPYFLQVIHHHTPLTAGYMTAAMAGGWSLASLLSSGRMGRAADRMVRIGPICVTAALLVLAVMMPERERLPIAIETLLLVIALAGVGFGVGLGWPHLLTRVLKSAPAGEENLASSAITTVQLYAMAIGAALAGLIANAAGLSNPGGLDGARHAAYWLFGSFAVAPMCAIWLCNRMLRPGLSSKAVPFYE